MAIAITQFYFMVGLLKDRKELQDINFDNTPDGLYDRMSDKQYKYILALYYQEDYIKLREILLNLNFKQYEKSV